MMRRVGHVARVCAVAALVACGPPPRPRPPPLPPRATVHVTAESCIEPRIVEIRLEQVLVDHRAMDSGLVIEVGATLVETTTTIKLQAVRPNGDIGLAREFTLGRADCESAAQLLALSVDRWLSAFPEWADPPLPPAPSLPASRWTEILLGGALNGIWRPFGADAQASLIVDRGARRDRFGATAVLRGSVPQRFGGGRFQQTSILAGANWRHRAGAWETRAEARAGVLLVSGIGLVENDSDLLVWWEAALFGGRNWSWGAAGIEIAATALQHRAVTRDGLVSEDIPLLRIGISGTFGLRTQTP